ncbi:GNAT family N-acetyltransferase [uncultured Pseudokineococcus sp.]|uniref:GNAT family N-acetyltransferase n=1 Tax=uncultured Pseudokineococcus sp. TaxID=1642928 RepID=UPI00260DB62E|nr:GNAT family N-acetyltransferase [uncultured Pseudokineococcus sp.]
MTALDDRGAAEVALRLVAPEDAAVLTALAVSNRDFLAPYEPERDEDFYTVDVQRRALEGALERHAAGRTVPLVVLKHGEVVGRLTVNDVVQGALQSASLGYWVSEHAGGRGVATAAVALAVRLAGEELGLHRLEASTLPDNARSQAVLARNGFERIGHAPRYLRIAGRWRDHDLFQRVLDD